MDYDFDFDRKGKSMPTPFPFIEEIKTECNDTSRDWAGINIWKVKAPFAPGACPAKFIPSISKLYEHEAYLLKINAVPVDSPVRSYEDPTKMSVLKFYNRIDGRLRDTLEQFLDDFMASRGPSQIPYLTDIDDFHPWKEDMAHFMNTVRLAESPLNLCSLMLSSPIDFPGFLTASWYFKVAWSFFRAHMEQLFGPSLNFCYQGSTTWWCIKRKDLKRYEAFLIKYIKTCYQMDRQNEWDKEEDRLLLALLYAKRTFIDPRILKANNIEVFQLNQTAGDAVMLDGDIVHLGVCCDDVSVNEAINFLPVSWLVRGLSHLNDWVQWMESYIRCDDIPRTEYRHSADDWEKVRSIIFNKGVKGLVGKHCPRLFTIEFLRTVKRSIYAEKPEVVGRKGEKQEDTSSLKKRKRNEHTAPAGTQAEPPLICIDYSELDDRELKQAITHIDNIVTFLSQEKVKEWYVHNCDEK
jgi:hypothetical protein